MTTKRYEMTIAGKAVTGTDHAGVIDPATGQVFAHVPSCTAEQLDAAMESAHAAQKAWSRDVTKRKQALRDCAARLRDNADALASLLTNEQGKPLGNAKDEIAYATAWLDFTATLDLPVEVVHDDETRRAEIRRRPLGVVAAITPWNFPVVLAVWKIAPALLAGNTVVVKPSPFTPCTTLLIVETLRDVLPPGALNAVSGGDELGAAITAHATPRKVSFTGSVATGKKVLASSAADLKRVTLELGGNDAAIVLDDVDPKAIAPKLFWGALANNGQFCSAIKRLYVHDAIFDRVVTELSTIAKNVKVGSGTVRGNELGPINNKPQLSRVMELVDEARARGAKIHAGGARIGEEGYFYAPTIVTGIAEGTRLVDEEQFGPALPIMRFTEIDDAVRRANATHFGLSGSVWSRDRERAAAIASELECGSAWVNQHSAYAPTLPFGGLKWSGVGVENSLHGLLQYTDLQVVNVSKV